MKTFRTTAMLAALVIAALATFAFATDPAKKEASPGLKSVSCPPECGFMCRTHDEQELIEIVKAHVLKSHGKALTDDQVKSLMQTEPARVAAK